MFCLQVFACCNFGFISFMLLLYLCSAPQVHASDLYFVFVLLQAGTSACQLTLYSNPSLCHCSSLCVLARMNCIKHMLGLERSAVISLNGTSFTPGVPNPVVGSGQCQVAWYAHLLGASKSPKSLALIGMHIYGSGGFVQLKICS